MDRGVSAEGRQGAAGKRVERYAPYFAPTGQRADADPTELGGGRNRDRRRGAGRRVSPHEHLPRQSVHQSSWPLFPPLWISLRARRDAGHASGLGAIHLGRPERERSVRALELRGPTEGLTFGSSDPPLGPLGELVRAGLRSSGNATTFKAVNSRGQRMTDKEEPQGPGPGTSTRQRLVDAATELMWKHGIGEVSVDVILERAGVLRGSFYHFFASKADLLLECLDNVWRHQSEQLAAIYARAATPQDALTQHLKLLAQVQIDGNERLGFVPGTFNMSMPTSLLHDDPRIGRKLQELMDSNLHHLESGLQQIAESRGASDSVKTTARLLSYSVAGAVLAARMNNSLKPLEDFKLFLADALTLRVTAQPRAQRSRTNTRQRLIDAATDLMWKHGIGEVSVDMILERADVMKGSFYHFFAAKTDLLLECLDNVWRRQAERLAVIYAEAPTPEAALEQHLQMLAQAQIEGNERLGFVPGSFNMSMPTSLLREDPRITGKLHELMESNRHYLEKGLQQIADRRGLSRSVKVTARLLSYRVAGAVLAARMNNSLKPLADFKVILATALGDTRAED